MYLPNKIPDCWLGGEEIASEIHFDAGKIPTEAGSRARIGICGFLRKQTTEKTKNVEYRQGIAVSWVSNASHRASTSSYAVEIQALFYGLGMARMLKGLLAELMLANVGVEIPTYIRIGNSDASHQVSSVNTATGEKLLNGFL